MNLSENYFLDNYGSCSMLAKCHCRKFGYGDTGEWGGQICPNWTPQGAKSEQDLLTLAKQELVRRKNEI